MYSPSACIATAVVLPLLGVLAVCLRFWVRLRLQPSYVGADDIFIVIGSFLVCGMGALQITCENIARTHASTRPLTSLLYLE